ncbi:helix-turn-helix domain-containing protein [Nonomuraea sp. NPDC046570]|uniref:helix-turn-helix domain-containing protein n=1 Tax=Nonomuraea sp. NPDC046570 TaxID=3155255 RepID=UPI003405E144
MRTPLIIDTPTCDAARARGQRLGRPPALTPEQVRHARDLLTQPDNTVASIARLLGVSRSTLYSTCRSCRRAGPRCRRAETG